MNLNLQNKADIVSLLSYFTIMTKNTHIPFILIFLISILLLYQNTARGYGYAREEDPLIKTFKDVIVQGKQSNWPDVITEVNTISDRIEDVRTIFHVDLRQRIDHAIQQKDFQTLTKHMANLVFLAICEKFYYNLQEKLEIFTRSKVRLQLAEEYYLALLSGNVRNYDVRHNTHVHEDIYNKFVKARDSLGSVGFLGAGAVKPDIQNFGILTKEIEGLILKAFPYFER